MKRATDTPNTQKTPPEATTAPQIRDTRHRRDQTAPHFTRKTPKHTERTSEKNEPDIMQGPDLCETTPYMM